MDADSEGWMVHAVDMPLLEVDQLIGCNFWTNAGNQNANWCCRVFLIGLGLHAVSLALWRKRVCKQSVKTDGGRRPLGRASGDHPF